MLLRYGDIKVVFKNDVVEVHDGDTTYIIPWSSVEFIVMRKNTLAIYTRFSRLEARGDGVKLEASKVIAVAEVITE